VNPTIETDPLPKSREHGPSVPKVYDGDCQWGFDLIPSFGTKLSYDFCERKKFSRRQTAERYVRVLEERLKLPERFRTKVAA